MATTGTLIGAVWVQGLSPPTVAVGVDWGDGVTTGFNFSTGAFRSPGFLVNGTGAIASTGNVNASYGNNVTNNNTGYSATANSSWITNAGAMNLTVSSTAGGPFADMQSTVNGTFFVDSKGAAATISMRTGATPTAALNISASQVIAIPAVSTGTPVASLCIDAGNNIIKKTTAGSCI
jgi:hypothetical protein